MTIPLTFLQKQKQAAEALQNRSNANAEEAVVEEEEM
jgi:hypothetical protein